MSDSYIPMPKTVPVYHPTVYDFLSIDRVNTGPKVRTLGHRNTYKESQGFSATARNPILKPESFSSELIIDAI